MERTTQETFEDCLELIGRGNIGVEEIARELARDKGFSYSRLDDAIRNGAEARYAFCLSKIYSGNKGYENAARQLAITHELDLEELEKALNYTKPQAMDF